MRKTYLPSNVPLFVPFLLLWVSCGVSQESVEGVPGKGQISGEVVVQQASAGDGMLDTELTCETLEGSCEMDMVTHRKHLTFFFTATRAGVPASDGIGFLCSLDGSSYRECYAPLVLPGLTDRRHVVMVAATDREGHVDRSAARFTWVSDATPPDTILTGKPLPAIRELSAVFGFKSDEEDATFECSVDGGDWAACKSPHSLTALQEGLRTMGIRAVDPAGNADPTPARHAWWVDVTPPETSVSSDQPKVTLSRAIEFTLSATNGKDPDVGATFECSLDVVGYSPCKTPVAFSAVKEGWHTFKVRAKDASGNIDLTPAELTWKSGSTPPDTTLTGSPTDPMPEGDAVFTFTCSEPECVFQCRVDVPEFAACVSPKSYSSLPDGYHTFEVRGVDPAGNADPSPESYYWRVDLFPPAKPTGFTVTIVTPSRVDLAWNHSGWDTLGFKIERKKGSGEFLDTGLLLKVSARSAVDSGLVPETAYTYRVAAFDLTGNTSYSPEATVIMPADSTPPTFFGMDDLISLSDTEVKLIWEGAWDEVTPAGSLLYEICRSETSGECSVSFTVLESRSGCPAPPQSCSHTALGLAPGAPYYFLLRVSDQSGNRDANTVELKRAYLTNATSVSGGQRHTCALLGDSTAQCWGQNSVGQLGEGTDVDSLVAVPVKNLSTAATISAGGWHSCSLLNNGTVQCWGWNSDGQLGTGNWVVPYVPAAVTSLTGATQVSAGYVHTCARLSDSTLRCWGNNAYGQLGDGTTIGSNKPAQVSGLNNAVAVSTGRYHSCAVLGDSTVKCWGRNDRGQLGNGGTSNSSTPVAAAGIGAAGGIEAGADHTCALLNDGRVQCWGRNLEGQLGDGTTDDRASPVDVGVASATAVRAGDWHTCALLSDSAVRCWGYNASGQLGDGTFNGSKSPIAVSTLSTATGLDVGMAHSCAILNDKSVLCWGENGSGQVGRGFGSLISTPKPVLSSP